MKETIAGITFREDWDHKSIVSLGGLVATAGFFYWEYTNEWPAMLALNLALASLLGRAADQARADMPCPVSSPEGHRCMRKCGDHAKTIGGHDIHRSCDPRCGWWL